jgi:hypothetical protein
MVSLTLSIPEELKKKMGKFPEINWSEIARTSILERIKRLELAEILVSKSKLTEKDIREISKKIKTGISKEHDLK